MHIPCTWTMPFDLPLRRQRLCPAERAKLLQFSPSSSRSDTAAQLTLSRSNIKWDAKVWFRCIRASCQLKQGQRLQRRREVMSSNSTLLCDVISLCVAARKTHGVDLHFQKARFCWWYHASFFLYRDSLVEMTLRFTRRNSFSRHHLSPSVLLNEIVLGLLFIHVQWFTSYM